MPVIWNDKTYLDRIKKQRRYDKFFLYPPFIISSLIWFFWIGDKISLANLFLVSLMTTISFYALMGLILQLPNHKIPDNYHPRVKTAMWAFQFLMSLFVSYVIWHAIIQPIL